jgi:eukaryotic-like serine/threonine-protein kinase
MARRYDLFLSYNSRDRDAVEKIHESLKALDLRPWFDRESLTPGRLWQEEAEEGLKSCRAAAVFIGPNGIGPWESLEMRVLLTRVARQGFPLIPVALPGAPAELELPAFLAELTWVDLRTGITEEKIADLVRGIPKGKRRPRRALSSLLPASGSAAAPASPVSPERRELLLLLDKVEGNWLRDVLDRTTPEARRLELELEERPVEHSLAARMVPGAPSLLSGKAVVDLFLERERSLLILGDAGSGKTTTLLLLLQGLANLARSDPEAPIPVVLQLPSWAEHRLPQGEWMVGQIRLQYQTGAEPARQWLREYRLLPLLDGLDEVDPDCRAACVDAINDWLADHGLHGLAVCCRTRAHEELNDLRLTSAVAVRPLSPEKIEQYAAAAPGGETLRTVLGRDEDLRELARTPQLLSLLEQACRDSNDATPLSASGSHEERRRELFDGYVDSCLKRNPAQLPRERTLRALSWLARGMQRHGSSLFQVEQLQPDWLPPAQRWQYFLLSRTFIGALLGIPIAAVSGFPWMQLGFFLGFVLGGFDAFAGPRLRQPVPGQRGLLKSLGYILGLGFCGLLFARMVSIADGQFFGLLSTVVLVLILGSRSADRSASQDIRLAEALSWRFWSWKGAVRGGLVGAALGVLFWLVDRADPTPAAIVTLPLLLIGIVIGGLFGAVRGRTITSKWLPNQGIWLTLKHTAVLAVAGTAFFSLMAAAVLFPLSELWPRMVGPATEKIPRILILGATFGVEFALYLCGLDVLQHYVLRAMLGLRGYAPYLYPRFLDSAADAGLLLKSGGSYLFFYGRPMLEHLASRPEDEPRPYPQDGRVSDD